MVSLKSAASLAGRGISIQGDAVVKLQKPESSRRERLRTAAGRELGRQTGLFVVPEILSSDDERGELVFERMQLTGFRQALSGGTKNLELVNRAARALAAIHQHLAISDEATPVSGPAWTVGLPDRVVPLHGDFGVRNLFYLGESDRIAIIDWSNADWLNLDGDLGAPEIDVAVFLMSLFHRRLFGPWPVPGRHQVARHFLMTYNSASPRGLNRKALQDIVAAITPGFTRLTRLRKGSLYALGCRHALIDLDLFLRRLSRTG